MKKLCIILTIIMVISFTIAAVLSVGEIGNWKKFTNRIDEIKTIEYDDKTCEIEINAGMVEKVNVISTEEEEIKIEIRGEYTSLINSPMELDIDKFSNRIKISLEETKFYKYISIGNKSNNLVLDIYIPEKYNEKLSINVVCENLNIDNINSDNIIIGGVANKMLIEKVSGELEINSVTSDVEITYSEFNHDLIVNSVTSEIIVNIPLGSDYRVRQKGISGSTKYYIDNVKNDRARTEGKHTIEVNGITGELKINEYTI